eukprot:4437000-Pleurochrysis_carterae.AAC.2
MSRTLAVRHELVQCIRVGHEGGACFVPRVERWGCHEMWRRAASSFRACAQLVECDSRQDAARISTSR